jgi:cation transport regulator
MIPQTAPIRYLWEWAGFEPCAYKLSPSRYLNAMPYRENRDLPSSVRRHLPDHAQDIYREAFNAAWERYGADPRREEIAHRVAWAAVKRRYRKLGDEWFPIAG